MRVKPRYLGVVLGLWLALPGMAGAPLPAKSSNAPADVAKIYGRIQLVTSFTDYRVQIVSSFADLHVQTVSSFADSAGKWQIVTSFPDFKIQVVDSFPDFTIRYVESFPGPR